jgi:hypothetical protein
VTDPIYAYRQPGRTHEPDKGCEAITGGAFIPQGVWPKAFRGDYLFADYVCGKIFRLQRVAGRYRARVFATGLGESSAVHLRFGPGPSGTMLYYTTLRGAVWRIGYATDGQPPTAAALVRKRFGPEPLDAASDARSTYDWLALAWDSTTALA